MYSTGFETNPMSMDIMSVTISGIQMVLSVIFAAFAAEMTGAIMSATTAGRIPMNIEERV